jgi:phosphoribosyl-AMP cyclohydrolase
LSEAWLDEIKWNVDGLVPAIAQEADSGKVLMLAWMSRESLALTAREGRAVYWSRSRGKLWRKGETSGNVQRIVEMRTDCDQDAIWLKVETTGAGATCHTGRRSCFYRSVPLGASSSKGLSLVWVDAERQFDPETVYGHAAAAKGTLKSS